MGYYIRFLSTSTNVIPVQKLQDELNSRGLAVKLTIEAGNDTAWDQIALDHDGGPSIAVIERNPVTPDSLGQGEIEEFIDLIEGEKPASAVKWLQQYLPKVRTCYAFQLLSGTDVKDGWNAVYCVRDTLWPLGGIMQADGEGFSNEDGYHILWEFSDRVKGPWWMGVLQNGEWIHFQMELSNRQQREAFCRGEVPENVELASDL